jgi:ketosteroid isomerase-like protein
MTLNEAIETLQTLCRNGDAQALYQEMFAEDAAVSGEGASGITVGCEVLAALTEMLKITPYLSIRSVRTTELGDGSAVTWLEWTSPPAEGEPGATIAFRSLTAWRKRGDAWVIAADMYGLGAFAEA